MSGWLQLVATAAFTVGLLGGVHCAAMCGGIVAACTPARCGGVAARWRYALAYNAGRIGSYTVAGALAGAAGQGALMVRGGPVAQQAMLGMAGVSMLLLALYLAGVTRAMKPLERAGARLWRLVQPYSRAFLPANTLPRALGLGAVWGWLPCGMVYGVLLTALASGDAVEGAVIMAAFGLGTLPNVLAIAAVAGRVSRKGARPVLRRVAAVFIALLAGSALWDAVHPASLAAFARLCRTFG
jgi:sulfite exporter TauE/SafE